MDEWVWSNGGMILTGETEVLGEKPFPLPLPQILLWAAASRGLELSSGVILKTNIKINCKDSARASQRTPPFLYQYQMVKFVYGKRLSWELHVTRVLELPIMTFNFKLRDWGGGEGCVELRHCSLA